MEFSFEHFKVELRNEPNYDVNSSDNSNSYQLEHFAGERKNYANCHGIKVRGTEHEFNAVVLADGGGTGIHSSCATINANELLLCCGDHVFCLVLPSLELKWKVKADEATCLELYPMDDAYIVHGELEISRIDNSGNIVWQQGGEDIFIHPEGNNNFKLTPERIEVSDWNNRQYSFDVDGNVLKNN
ncbi:MAG: hypothetical protein R3345_07015 [Fulvivirga sp.]|nr:hypothetical protein [Fulvivirga sp.]